MFKIVIVSGIILEQYVLYRLAYALGIKQEQQARLRRLRKLKQLLNG